MLEKIIGIVKKGKTVSVDSLSVQLGISRKMTDALLENLEVNGYLKKMGNGKGDGNICSRCSGCCKNEKTDFTIWEYKN